MPDQPEKSAPSSQPDPNIRFGPDQKHWRDQVRPQDVHVRAPSADPIDVYPQVPNPSRPRPIAPPPEGDYKMLGTFVR